jgi:hypothetical protein
MSPFGGTKLSGGCCRGNRKTGGPHPAYRRSGRRHSSSPNGFVRRIALAWRERSLPVAYSASAARSASATSPWVGTTHAVGQRVMPLRRMNSATAASVPLGVCRRPCSMSLVISVVPTEPFTPSVVRFLDLGRRGGCGHSGYPCGACREIGLSLCGQHAAGACRGKSRATRRGKPRANFPHVPDRFHLYRIGLLRVPIAGGSGAQDWLRADKQFHDRIRACAVRCHSRLKRNVELGQTGQ